MMTCFSRYHTGPAKTPQFRTDARIWDEVIPRCGADSTGHFPPGEGFLLREDRTFLKLASAPHGDIADI